MAIWFLPVIFDLWSEFRGHLLATERSNQKNNIIFELLGPKNLYFNIHHGKITNLNFDLWSEVRGHLVASDRSYKKKMSFLNSLAQKTYISIYIMVKRKTWILTFDQRSKVIFWSLRGQITTNDVIFEYLDPKILHFNMHHSKRIYLNFWPLIKGLRSFCGF